MKRRTGLLATVIGAALVASTPVVAQDASPDPLATVGPIDVASAFPDGIGGRPWQDVAVVTGTELFAGLDPGDEADAARISANQELLRAANKDLDALTSVTGVRVEEDGSFSVVNAYQIAGADPDIVRDVVLQQVVDSYLSVMAEPTVDVLDIDGLTAVLVADQALLDSGGRARSVYLVASGDTVWTIDVDEAFVVEAIRSVPRDTRPDPETDGPG